MKLKTYMSTHTGDKPYASDICNKKFFSVSSLKTHAKNYTNERP